MVLPAPEAPAGVPPTDLVPLREIRTWARTTIRAAKERGAEPNYAGYLAQVLEVIDKVLAGVSTA